MYGLKVLRIAQDFKVIVPHERRPLPQGVQRLRATLVNAPLRIRWDRYGWAFVTTFICSASALVLYPHFEPGNLLMDYVLSGPAYLHYFWRTLEGSYFLNDGI
jgi:hypothetical protein